MKKLSLLFVFALLVTFSSCQLIGDIFKTGVGVGVFAVILVIVVIVAIIGKAFGGGK